MWSIDKYNGHLPCLLVGLCDLLCLLSIVGDAFIFVFSLNVDNQIKNIHIIISNITMDS